GASGWLHGRWRRNKGIQNRCLPRSRKAGRKHSGWEIGVLGWICSRDGGCGDRPGLLRRLAGPALVLPMWLGAYMLPRSHDGCYG
ncbi:hypothetical protein, partial [Komagataeibacter kakiaceti]|uniref:hypothetical protein n=1 Tax=Komagataeibacter kakiaceti TaxID=943261 RepID=UPI001A7EE232